MKRKIKSCIYTSLLSLGIILSIGSSIPNLFHSIWDKQIENEVVAETQIDPGATNTSSKDSNSVAKTIYATVKELLYPNEPEGFANTSDPYGLQGTDCSTVLDPLNELVEYTATDYNSSKKFDRQYMHIYQDLTYSYVYSAFSNLSKTSTDIVSMNEEDDPLDSLTCLKAEPFDPNGTGRDDHLAILGLNYDNYSLYLTIYDVAEKVIRSFIEIDGFLTFVDDYLITKPMILKDFFDITHGDYDGDGHDTIVIFSSSQFMCLYDSLFEYEYHRVEGEDYGETTLIDSSKNKLVNEKYRDFNYRKVSFWDKSDTELSLRGELETGDINNDGIDDLLMVSNIIWDYDSSSCIGGYDRYLNASYLGVTLGSKTKSSILVSDSEDTGMYLYQDFSSQGNRNILTYNAGITVGNIDGNGNNCIVAAGSNLTHDVDTGYLYAMKTYGIYKIQYYNGKFRYAVNNEIYQNTLKSYEDYASYRMFRYQTYKIQSFSYLGLGHEDAIYFNGLVFTLYNSSTPKVISELSAEVTPYENLTFYNTSTRQVGYRYIDDVIVGNFTNSYGGCQQIIYTCCDCDPYLTSSLIGEKTGFIAYLGDMNDKTPSVGSQYSPTYYDSHYPYSHFLACTDCDDDGAQIRLNTKAYIYSDVKPLAILQAAPYFSDLYDNDHYNLQDSGDTSITISFKKGEAYGQSSSYESELGVYLTESAIVETLEMTTGDTEYFESGWEESMSYEVSESFHSGSVDTVVVYQVPLYFYVYDVYDADTNSWVEGDYIIYTEGEPLFSQLTVSEYNNYVNIYQAVTSITDYDLKDLNIVPLDLSLLDGNEGNPYAYNLCEPVGESYLLGHDGGYSSFRYSIQKESTTYTEESYGTYYNLNAGAGFSAFGCEAFAGVNYAFTEMSKSNSSQVSGKTLEIEAIVGDIRGFAFEDQGYDLSLSREYGFTWKLGTYDTGIKTCGMGGTANLMVYSYVVSSIYEPVGAPILTKCEYSDPANNEITLEWIAPNVPSSSASIKGYNVYTYEKVDGINEKPVKINTSLLSSSQTSYTFISSNPKWERFFIRAVTDDSKCTEGLRSNEGTTVSDIGLAIKSAKYVSSTSDNDDIYYVYDIAFNNGTKAEKLYLKAGNDNNGVCKDVSSFLYAKNHGFSHDYQTYLYVIECLCSYTNHLYTKDNVISMSKCEGPTITSSVCAICGKTHNTLSEQGKGHTYQDYVVEPSCSELGYTIHICKECESFYKDNYTDCIEHTYITKVIDPTRTEQGYTIYKCVNCSHYYYDDYVDKLNYTEFYSGHGEPSNSLGHDGDSYVDNDTYDFYEKVSGVWTVTGSIKGKDGVSILKIELSKTEGLVDTYTITYSDGKTSTFTVTNGQNAESPSIEINNEGYWVINGVVSDIKAVGQDGKNGSTPNISISEDGYWVIDGVKTATKASGEDEEDVIQDNTPYIGKNGHWYINEVDTGIAAYAEQVTISEIKELSSEGNNTTYQVSFSNGSVKTFDIVGNDTSNAPYVNSNGNWVVNGEECAIGAIKGESVANDIEVIASDSNGGTYKVNYSDGTSSVFSINTGIDGASIKMIFKGNGTPSNDFGNDDFIYVDTTNWIAYKKVNGNWNKTIDLKEVIASSMYVHDGFWYIGTFKTEVPADGNEGKQIKSISKSINSQNRYVFHVIFTDETSWDYVAPSDFEPISLTTGLIDPVDNIGDDSDVYLNVKSMNFFRKVDGEWLYRGNLNEKVSTISKIELTGNYDKANVYTITYSDDTTSIFLVGADENIINPTVTINDGGYWNIDGVDTDVLALGSDGKNGKTIIAPSEGYWAINGVNSGVEVNYKNVNNPSTLSTTGIVLICVGSALLLAGAVALIVILTKKKRVK